MVVAVESSADELGGALAAALRARLGGEMRLTGVGGPRLAAQGLISAFDPRSLAVLGVFNALAAYPDVLRQASRLAVLAGETRPDVAILIDAWGFNLRVARRLRRVAPELPLIKYVAPQVWATRPGRARTLAGAVDHLLTIHSFDAPYFEREGLATTFVGNPSLNRDFSDADPARARSALGIAPDAPILLLLPGSRAGEADRLLPAFRSAAERVAATRPDLIVAVALAASIADRVRPRLLAWPCPPRIVEGDASRRDLMRAATVALACSGTVTTELALAGCPMVVAYRLDPFTHLVARALIRTPYISLLNVAAGRFVVPERVQDACAGPILAADLARLLDDDDARDAQIAAQTDAVERMRGGIADPTERAADAVMEILGARRNAAPPGQPRVSMG
jgi:lipid-A-disaccharide synthase